MLLRRLAMIALAVASLATAACSDLTRPNEISIKAEPPPAPAAPAPQAPAPTPAAAAPAAPAMPPSGGG